MTAPRRTVGVYSQITQEIVHRNLLGMMRYCEEVGGFAIRDFRMWDLISDDPQSAPPWKGSVDGIVLSMEQLAELPAKAAARWVLSGGAPAVSTAADWLDARVPCVHTSYESLGQLAVEHLAQCKCASYLFVGYRLSTGSAARGKAFRDALARQGHRGVECSMSFGPSGAFEDVDKARGEKELVAHLQKLRKPIGVWALNDFFAATLCNLCEALGLAVPEQVKILGVDDAGLSRTHQPALSSIRTPGERIGYLAMRTLHKMLDRKRGVRKVTEVPALELVARASTIGAPLANGSVDAALKYIARHAGTQLTVEHVADTMGISRRSLEERFQRSIGHSPGQEIQRVRLEKAKDLLEKTRFSISQIASMVGFQETAAFSKFFAEQTGMSPREFRASQQ